MVAWRCGAEFFAVEERDLLIPICILTLVLFAIGVEGAEIAADRGLALLPLLILNLLILPRHVLFHLEAAEALAIVHRVLRRQFLASEIYFASDCVVVEVVIVEILSLIRTGLGLLLQVLENYLVLLLFSEIELGGTAGRDWRRNDDRSLLPSGPRGRLCRLEMQFT